jgi:hypothetical protein
MVSNTTKRFEHHLERGAASWNEWRRLGGSLSRIGKWTMPVLAACLCCGDLNIAQTNSSMPEKASVEPAPTPGALYKQAMHPLDVVRSSMNNWSDSETAAFLVGVRMAKDGCAQSHPEDFSGGDLYDLARLCSLGQNWNAANTAATRYLDSRAEPYRTQAFALSINALMHLNGTDLAVATANNMMNAQPYDAEAAYAVRYLKDALEKEGKIEAVALAENEHSRIVKALEAGVALKAVHGDAVMSMGLLYESAMQLAFWQRFYGLDEAAAATVKDIEDAVAKVPAPPAEDRQRIEAVRTQFELLGESMPTLKTAPVVAAKEKGSARPAMQIGPDYGAATVLVLFPDWCPQCRKLMKRLTEFGSVNKDTAIRAYGLMYFDEPAVQGMAAEARQAAHEQNLKEVEGTSTMLVDANTARTLGVLDFPLGIVLDHSGSVRYVGVLPEDAFNGNGCIENVLRRMNAAHAGAPRSK